MSTKLKRFFVRHLINLLSKLGVKCKIIQTSESIHEYNISIPLTREEEIKFLISKSVTLCDIFPIKDLRFKHLSQSKISLILNDGSLSRERRIELLEKDVSYDSSFIS